MNNIYGSDYSKHKHHDDIAKSVKETILDYINDIIDVDIEPPARDVYEIVAAQVNDAIDLDNSGTPAKDANDTTAKRTEEL